MVYRALRSKGPFAQSWLMTPCPLNPALGTVSPDIKTKAAHGALSTDLSPSSDEMHDPVPTHLASEESNYILDTVAGTRSETPRALHGDSCTSQK